MRDDLEVSEPDEDLVDAPPDEDLVDAPPPRRPIPAFQSIPYRPVRSAIRDEAGRQLVGGAVKAAGTLLPGLLAAGGLAWAGSRIVDAWRSWNPWRRRKGDTTIEVKVVDIGRRVETRSRVVDVDDASPEEAAPASAAPPAPAKPPPVPRAVRRARLLKGR
jgi:hypothetical protein